MNNLTVKSAAHDVDIGKNSDDLRKLERQRVEDRAEECSLSCSTLYIDSLNTRRCVFLMQVDC